MTDREAVLYLFTTFFSCTSTILLGIVVVRGQRIKMKDGIIKQLERDVELYRSLYHRADDRFFNHIMRETLNNISKIKNDSIK